MTQTSMTLALAGFSFLLTVIWGSPLIRVLRHLKVGETIRVDGPERHFSKFGTPTMGGLLIVLPVLLITMLMNASSLLGVTYLGRSVMLPVGIMVIFAVLGAIDDWQKLRGRRGQRGMPTRVKFLLQVIIALVAAIGLSLLQVPQLYFPGFSGEIRIPLLSMLVNTFVGYVEINLIYILAAAFIIVASTNAVNLTDGLDGLAGLISATAFATYGGIALMQGQIFIARFCFTIVGTLFGFLWFNVHPAQLFMGDTGSLPLGASLGVVAMMTGQWALLPVIAIIPFSVVLSDILQVTYFRLTHGKRLFKMAPIHHHFELTGWSETQVVQRFWLISLLFAMIGVALAFV